MIKKYYIITNLCVPLLFLHTLDDIVIYLQLLSL